MTGWIDELNVALRDEYGKKPRIGILATVDTEARPHARSVVCRKVEDDGSLWVTSDSRSDKNAQLRDRPSGELVFWLPGRSEQFRLAGFVDTLSVADPRRTEAWTGLSDASRSMFFWRAPGTEFIDVGDLPDRVPADRPVPPEFSLLILRPDRVEHLDLKPHPHLRRRWDRETGWKPRRVHA